MGESSPAGTPAQNIGKYALIEKIGEGHLGPVYRGFDQALGTPVVVRILCDGIKWDARLQATFDREGNAVAALQHPNIARICEVGQEGQTRYVAMESLGSGTLENLIAQNSSVSVEKKLSIMIQVAEGLGHAHSRGVLHRDLTPGKIHLTPEGRIKIRDFAIAHVLKKHLPRPVVRWGSPIYLCPEQIRQEECDERSDIFSAGTIFYELVTHCHPFHDKDSNRALDNILSDAPIPTFEKFPEAPPGIWNILRSCLEKKPEDRFRNTEEIANACRDLLKSLAEDTQLMLAELYAALPALRKVIAEKNASKNTIQLLEDTEKLLRGEKKADYAQLDRLMTLLMEQYPTIQAAASAAPALGSICPQIPTEDPVVEPAPKVVPQANEETAFEPRWLEAKQVPDESTASIPAAPDESEVTGKAGEPEPASDKLAEAAPAPQAESSEPTWLESGQVPTETVEQPATPEAPDSQGVPGKEPSLPAESETDAEHASPQAASYPAAPAISIPVPQAVTAELDEPDDSRGQRGRSYRAAAVLLALLALAAAAYILFGSGAAAPLWGNLPSSGNPSVQAFETPREAAEGAPPAVAGNSSDILMQEARALSAENRVEESRIILRRILETDPSYEPALAALQQLDAATGATPAGQPRSGAHRIASLIEAGRLQEAKDELDRLQRARPESSELPSLLRRWQAANTRRLQEQRKRQDEQNLTTEQKEETWNRQLEDLLARGKYGEASTVLALWRADNPQSARAAEANSRIEKIQGYLETYESALAENRYGDALNALSNAEKLNPADPRFAELRRRTEAKSASARAFLTVYRLGAKGSLLLDGQPIGKDGELEHGSIPIGTHTVSVADDSGPVALRVQEYSEGQRITLVYDLSAQSMRAMTEADREAIARRKSAEGLESFAIEHDHGFLRGSCRGSLSLDAHDISFSPASGSHGFRIPFRLFDMKSEGRSISFYYMSDSSHFQTFKFQDLQTADRFRFKWRALQGSDRSKPSS